jgi:branched-chain amino acid transport system ATP-binding protein
MTIPLLSMQGVSKRFDGLLALDDLQLQVRPAEIFGVIGPNGSGKTTLFNVITGVLPVSSGTIEFDGTDITNWSAQRICRAGICRTFQRSRLCLGLSIFDNLMVGNYINLHRGVWTNIINRAALRHELEHMVQRARDFMSIFDPRLANRMDELVGNQPMIDRRRIEICRALISSPRLLLLDEPSAGMTSREMVELMENILTAKRRMGGLTVIIIEHEMNVIEKITDSCAVLNFGRKICEGNYSEVMSNTEVREAYLGNRTARRKRERRTLN